MPRCAASSACRRSTRSISRGWRRRSSITSPPGWRSARRPARCRSPCRPAISAMSMPGTWRGAMGLPVERLVIGTNANDILARYLATGRMSIAAVTPSLSPSMDIQVSSNFERLLFELKGRNGGRGGRRARRVPRAAARCRPTTRPGARRAGLFSGHRVDDDGDAATRSPDLSRDRPADRPAHRGRRSPRRGARSRDRRDADGRAGDGASGEISRRGRARDRHPPAGAAGPRRARRQAASGSPCCPTMPARWRGIVRAHARRHGELAQHDRPARDACQRAARRDRPDRHGRHGIARPLGRCRHAARAGRDQRRRAFPRAHGVQGHRAAQRPRRSPRRSRRSAAISTPTPRAKAPLITPRC